MSTTTTPAKMSQSTRRYYVAKALTPKRGAVAPWLNSVMPRSRRIIGVVPGREGDRVTTLELFFDLAFVFAFTQVSQLMAHEHSAIGVLQGIVILALLWWSWTSYGWLANLAHADQGYVRIVMLIAMGSMFVVGLVVLEAFHDLDGGLFAPLVFVGAYLVARVTHAIAFAAVSEPRLRPAGPPHRAALGDPLRLPAHDRRTRRVTLAGLARARRGGARADRHAPHELRHRLADALDGAFHRASRAHHHPRSG